jgi:hypothetical protein
VERYQIARTNVILVFVIYFSISAYLMNSLFNTLIIDKPIIIKIDDWMKHIKSNIWLVIVCCFSLILHVHYLSLVLIVTGGGEVPYLYQTVRIYESLNVYWHYLFDFPVQYFFWALMLLFILLLRQNKIINSISTHFQERYSAYAANKLTKLLFVIFMFGIFNIYALFFPYLSYYEVLPLIRFPPVSKFIYLTIYFAFGTSHIGPRLVQLIFYLLSTIYLYRTIHLYREKEIALLGVTIYLFSPVIFSYASRAALESGAIFFIIIISFYFLRFIKGADNRDLILTSFFIGTGFLYKRGLLIMFFVCFTYLLFCRISKRNNPALIHFKILLLSLVPILPWFLIGTSNPFIWSHLTSFDGLSIVARMIQGQISPIIFILFTLSIIFIIFSRKDDISIFFGILFCAYYLLFTLMEYGEFNHRYIMALYPAMAVFLAQFVFSVTQRLRWKHTFKLISIILTIYLIVMSLLPRSSSSLITYKYKDHESQYFPVDKATDWIKNNTGDRDRVLSLFMSGYWYYLDKVYSDRERLDRKKIVIGGLGKDLPEVIYSMQSLSAYCSEKNISYVMFPYGPKNILTSAKPFQKMLDMTRYLKENIGNEFIKVAEFNYEDNYIFIYKMK